MKLTGSQLEKTINALISGYDSESELEMMVRLKLDLNLNVIVEGENLRQTVFELVTWADERGRIDDLIVGAQQFNEGNPDLQELLNDFVLWRAENQPPQPQPQPKPEPEDPSPEYPRPQDSSPQDDKEGNGARRSKLGWVAIIASLGAVVLALAFVLSNFLPDATTSPNGSPPLLEEAAAQVEVPSPTDTPVPPAQTDTPAPTDTPLPPPIDTPVPAPTDTPTPEPFDGVDEQRLVREVIEQEVALGNQRDLTGVLGLLVSDVRIISRARTMNDPSDDVVYTGIGGATEFYGDFFELPWGEYSLHNLEATIEGSQAKAIHRGIVSDGVLYKDVATYTLRKVGGVWRITEIEVGTIAAD